MTKLLMIDNYDSFTYNLVQYFGELGADVQVHRNDEIDLAGIAALIDGGVTRLVVSPGPCSPAEAGVSVAAIKEFAGRLPILGVCLGHQSIGAAFGGKIVRAQQLMHGKTSEISTTREGVFAGLPERFTVNRYHSLSIERATCPKELALTAWTDDGEIMGVRHTGFAHDVRIEGVQFHPESILTEHGHAMLKNFLS
ncbi:MAG: aminodeoxychorismate/anthranilate synthase component II [Proteobacteria bacterium]|nr:aminodeoxychorismate/anthranilate synthase component II [Pseudomonadota bacterium]